VIVSPDEIEALRTVIVAPLTGQGFSAPTRLAAAFGGRDGFVVLDQLRAVDKRRLVRNVGSLAADDLQAILSRLVEMFAP
jgi:mRNA interferase MazF